MQHDYNGFPNQSIANLLNEKFGHQTQLIEHNGHKLLLPLFDKDKGVTITPGNESVHLPKTHPIAQDFNTQWDISKHGIPRKPIVIESVNEEVRKSFTKELPQWCQHGLDMPIKFPESDVCIPGEISSLIPAIQRIISIEKSLNPDYDKYYAYLSWHQAFLQPGERMRENPFHVDGFQGPRWKTKHPVNHSYLLSDELQTVFYPLSFPLDSINPAFDDIYAEFENVINKHDHSVEYRPENFDIVLMDAYCVHRGDVAKKPLFRTWMRISWETRIFDRLGNSHNPLFNYNWEMVARDTDPRIKPRAELSL